MLSLIIPVYRNEASIPDLLAELQGLHQALAGALEVVFVVDGSPDRCHELLRTQLPRTGLDADEGPHEVAWTTPTGHTYTSQAPPALGHGRPPDSPLEAHLATLLAAA